jgi:hypothetical protein
LPGNRAQPIASQPLIPILAAATARRRSPWPRINADARRSPQHRQGAAVADNTHQANCARAAADQARLEALEPEVRAFEVRGAPQ